MAVEGPQPIPWTFVAGGTIVQYTFVKLSGANQVVACSGTTDKPIGVAQEGAVSGGDVPVCIAGITKIEGDADLGYGDLIGTSSDAQAAAYVPGTDTTKYVVGTVLIDNAAAGGLITAVINCANVHRAA